MSDGVKLSRLSNRRMMLSGWGSYARTKTYKFAASNATFASVLKRGDFPSVGCHSVKAVIGGASRQTASLSFPSMTGATVARVAVAPVSVGAGTGRTLGE